MDSKGQGRDEIVVSEIALTFDIEDWFCVTNMDAVHPFGTWGDCESRVEIGTDFILNELSRRNIRATFFILGWIAERNPEVVRKIHLEGHEIASHGYSHRSLNQLTPEAFEDELLRSKSILESLTNSRIIGYRAPNFSLTLKTLWALDIIRRCGFEYDSSIFPVFHPDYGIPDFPHSPQIINGIYEIPLSVCRFSGVSVPCAGGAYFRLFPFPLTRFMIRRCQLSQPVVMYFHPWEFDPEQPRVSLPFLRSLRHYTHIKQNRKKFQALLDTFQFTPLRDWIYASTLTSDYIVP